MASDTLKLGPMVDEFRRFSEIWHRRWRAQAEYSAENPPADLADNPAELARWVIRQSLAGAVGEYERWSCDGAIDFAIAILEDSNCHPEAAALEAAAQAAE